MVWATLGSVVASQLGLGAAIWAGGNGIGAMFLVAALFTCVAFALVRIGLGRIVALYCRSSTLYQIH